MVTYSPCEPANCYATLQQDPLCWVQATVTEGDLLMLDCTRDTQRVGWSTPGAGRGDQGGKSYHSIL